MRKEWIKLGVINGFEDMVAPGNAAGIDRSPSLHSNQTPGFATIIPLDCIAADFDNLPATHDRYQRQKLPRPIVPAQIDINSAVRFAVHAADWPRRFDSVGF